MNYKLRTLAKLATFGAACILSAYAVAPAPARADETTSALLDLLKAKGAISQAEYDKIKARSDAEAKTSDEKVRAAEAKAREAEAKARQAEAKAKSDSETSAAEIAKAKAETLTAADMPVPKMPTKAPVQYVTALTNCVGVRVNQVDICIKGDISFFGVEQWPQDHLPSTPVNGGLATVGQHASNSVRGGLLPSSIQVGISTNQNGWDVGAYFGIYVGGNNVNWGGFGANNGGSPFALGTPGVDFRQVFGTIGTPTFGTVKIGRDIGIFASDAILNDLTLFGVGTPAGNLSPGNTTLGRIGVGYIYTDFIPQITYKSPTVGGFTVWLSAMTPYDEVPFSGDAFSGTMTGHSTPMGQGKIQYINAFSPDAKVTLSTSAVVQEQQADCLSGNATFGVSSCVVPATVAPLTTGSAAMSSSTHTTAWAVDGFGMLDLWGWNFVAYGYTGKGVGTTGLFFDGVDLFGQSRRSNGGYFQAAYTFSGIFTVGASWGESRLNYASAGDALVDGTDCFTTAVAPTCLVKSNQSWIGFARYKLTDWVKLQAEYIDTRAENQVGATIRDQAVVAGTTFFW
jgi:hypothetical protein